MGQEVAPIDLRAVGGEGVDLFRRVNAYAQPFARATGGVAANDDHVANATSPLALHTNKPSAEEKYPVEAPTLDHGPIHLDAELGR